MSKGWSFNKLNFSSLLLADFLSLCDFIHSQPLYSAYLIFFFPHLLQLLFFLYPLLLSTSLLLVALLTVSPHTWSPTLEMSNCRYGLLSFACHTILDILQARFDDGVMFYLFDPFLSLASELEASMEFEVLSHQVREDLIDGTRGGSGGANESKEITNSSITSFGCKIEETYKENEISMEVTAGNANQEVMPSTAQSTSVGENIWKASKTCDVIDPDLKSYGSRRTKKEWKRTLAGKLYEERLAVDGSEGMDLLWEVYDVDSGFGKEKNTNEKAKNGKLDHLYEEEEEEEEEEMVKQLCCLEALQFSTMKMNLGMGRPNLVKISKALKGMGMFVKRKGKKS